MLDGGFRVWAGSTQREYPPWNGRVAVDVREARQAAEGARTADSPALRALVTSSATRALPRAERAPAETAPEPSAAPPEATTAAPASAPSPTESAPASPPTTDVGTKPQARYDPQTRLFRAEALAAHARGARAASVVRITSVSRWMLLATLLTALIMAGAVTAFGSVEETSAARGILRADFGVQAVVAGIGGTVQEVLVRAGDRVPEGGLIARLDAAPLQAELRAAETKLASIEQEWQEARRSLVATHERTTSLLASRLALIEQSRKNQQARIARRDARAAKLSTPELSGVVEDAVRDERDEAVDNAREELLRLNQERESLRLQAATAEGTFQQGIAAGEQRVREARAQRDHAEALLRQTELRAPSAGVVESLRGHSGLVLGVGDWIARVVRDEPPTKLVAFVAERDAAFLRTGALAAVEVDQLPLGEFGHLDAEVVRVAGELADRSELLAALGETAAQGPHVRVDLTLLDVPRTAAIRARLRPGTLVTARIPLRERRLLAIVFEPARRWLD